MKKFFYSVAVMAVSVLGLSLGSCGSDKDDVTVSTLEAEYVDGAITLPTPPYAGKIAKLEVDEPEQTGIKSIEISSDGYYIVNTVSKIAKAASDKLYYGQAILKDGKFEFSCAGKKISVTLNDFDTVSINGVEYATKAAPDETKGKFNEALCRTWTATLFHASITTDDIVLFNKKSTNLLDLQHKLFTYITGKDADIRDYIFKDNIDYTLFTEAGTFLMAYENGDAEYKYWTWTDGAKGIIEVYDSRSMTTKYLLANTVFNGDKMYFMIDLGLEATGTPLYSKLVITFVAADK